MINKIKLYLDTSVISYLCQVDAKDKMKITKNLWEYFKIGVFEIYLSQLVFDELKNCSIEKKLIINSHLNDIEYNAKS